jgi:hypothetical protein
MTTLEQTLVRMDRWEQFEKASLVEKAHFHIEMEEREIEDIPTKEGDEEDSDGVETMICIVEDVNKLENVPWGTQKLNEYLFCG